MEVKKLADGNWWVVGVPDVDGPVGPYDTRAGERDGGAEAAMRGLTRFEKYGDEPGFVSVEDSRGTK